MTRRQARRRGRPGRRGGSLLGRKGGQATDGQKIRTEYIAFAVVLAATVAVSVVAGSWIVLVARAVPALLIAEPTHFMIELPEHFGLNSQSDPNVLTNTRYRARRARPVVHQRQ